MTSQTSKPEYLDNDLPSYEEAVEKNIPGEGLKDESDLVAKNKEKSTN